MAATTSSARTSPAASRVLGVSQPHVPGGSAYGYPNIIDITDERNPKIVAKLMLEVNDHRNCELFLNEPLFVVGGLLDYSNERCVADRANDRCGLNAPIGDGGSPSPSR